eukprot:10885655-Prorocentrum_lima.AAC.1
MAGERGEVAGGPQGWDNWLAEYLDEEGGDLASPEQPQHAAAPLPTEPRAVDTTRMPSLAVEE